jgi:hypothetical protein
MMDADMQGAIDRITQQRNQDREDFVRLDERVSNALKSQDEIKASIKEVNTKLDLLLQYKAHTKGGIDVAKWIIESAKLGTAGFIGWLASTFGGSPPPG